MPFSVSPFPVPGKPIEIVAAIQFVLQKQAPEIARDAEIFLLAQKYKLDAESFERVPLVKDTASRTAFSVRQRRV